MGKKESEFGEEGGVMVFQITASPVRKEWYMIPELKDSHKSLQEDVRRGNFRDAKDSLAVFRRVALTCNDLIYKDAGELYKRVEAEVNEAMGPTSTGKSKERSIRDLKDIPLYES